jgi:GT2 family glycosyltransferase
MKILGHIHTFNDEEVIDRSLQALLDQTYPVAEVLVVDNCSTDGTLKRRFPSIVQIVRHAQNLGTSGAVISGMQYAAEHGFDWIWLFDADSAPHKDALEKLVDLYRTFPTDLQDQVWLMASLLVEESTRTPYHAFTLGGGRLREVRPGPERRVYEFDAAMWSGSLYKVSAVREVGYPIGDYVLDIGEFDYGYRGRRRGYRAFLHQDSLVEHNIGGQPSRTSTIHALGPFRLTLFELPPIRCYYLIRNHLYFWLYEYRERNIVTWLYCVAKLTKIMGNFIVRPVTHGPQLAACLRGVRDGISKQIRRRY